MPVEIKELVIRAVVQTETGRPTPPPQTELSAEVQQAVVEAAVKEVLRILRAGKER
jgi:hypothetical protein